MDMYTSVHSCCSRATGPLAITVISAPVPSPLTPADAGCPTIDFVIKDHGKELGNAQKAADSLWGLIMSYDRNDNLMSCRCVCVCVCLYVCMCVCVCVRECMCV